MPLPVLPASEDFARALGAVLRNARRERALTLKEASDLSDGAFKLSSIASYERGDRAITLERFCVLSLLYDADPRDLLGKLFDDQLAAGVTIHLDRLARLEEEGLRRLADYIDEVRTLRNEWSTRTIVLRADDVEAVAHEIGIEPALLRETLTRSHVSD